MNGASTMPWQRVESPHGFAAPGRDRLRSVRHGYCGLVLLAAAVQLVFFSSVEANWQSTLLAVTSSLIGLAYSLDSRRFRAYPISALVLLLYTTTATSGALLVKSLEWSALADRMQVPETTFSVLLVTQLTLLLTDYIYLRWRPMGSTRHFISQRLLQPLQLLRWPSDVELWMLGIMGCVSVLLTGTDFEGGASFGLASAGDKLMRAFGFLKFAPFLIPFRNALSGVPSRTRVPMLALGAYFAALVAISFATNSRSTFADAVPTVAICLLIATSLGRFELSRVPTVKLVLFGLVAIGASVLLSRVALAMVVVRDFRHNADVGMLVRMTFEALFSNEWLDAAKAKMDTSVTVGNYSETYVDSRFLGRFLLTKFHDNILYYFSLMGPDHVASYKGFMADRLAATLPDPVLRQLGIAVDKQDMIVSNGDYIIYLVDGWGLGGFKTGSMIGEVFGVWGWAFPLVLLCCASALFVVHDAFAAPTVDGRLAFAPLILLLIWNLCGTTAAFGLGAESVTAIPAGIVRGLPQDILVYLLAIAIVRFASKLTGRSQVSASPSFIK